MDVIDDIPRFHCTKRCKAPDSFYSGSPILTYPEDGVLFIEDNATKVLEWQIWTSTQKTDDLVIKINKTIIDHTIHGTSNGLTFWMEKDDIQFLGKFMKFVLKIQAEYDSDVTAWKIELENAKGGWNIVL